MKHYPHHISDFNNATRHLSRIERSIYRDLLDLYYETECALPLSVDYICRRIVANECSTDVQRMLNEFFNETESGWYHVRCEEEIEKYQANNSQRALAGKASAAAKALKLQQALNKRSTSVDIPLNGASTEKQNQSTNQPINQELIKEEKKPRLRAPHSQSPDRPDDVSEQVWGDWLQLRKKKSAPVTATVLSEAVKEAEKALLPLERFLAIWCARGSQGLQADWLKPNERGTQSVQIESFAERDARAKREAWEKMSGRPWPEQDLPGTRGIVIDAEPNIRRIT